jgi:galactonate dehydratase
MAAADGAWVAPHQSGGPVATAVCLQLAACVPNFLVQEYFDPFNEKWTRDLVTWAPELDLETGELSLPDGPGLGVDLNLDVALAHPYDPDAFLDVTSEGWEHRLGSHAAQASSGQ